MSSEVTRSWVMVYTLAHSAHDGTANPTALVSGFSTTGTLGSATTVGGVSRALPGIITIADADFFNELSQRVLPGASIELAPDLTSSAAAPRRHTR